MSKTLLCVAAGLGAYLLLKPKQAQSYTAKPAQVPRQYAHAAQQFETAVTLDALDHIGVKVKPQSASAKQKAVALSGTLGAVGGAAVCTAYGGAAVAPLCGAVGGAAAKAATKVTYATTKATAQVSLKAAKVAGNAAKKLKFW